METQRINGILFLNKKNVHPAIIAKIADRCLDFTRYYVESEGEDVYDGPKLLPREVYNIEIVEGKVFFDITLADNTISKNNTLGSEKNDLRKQGYL